MERYRMPQASKTPQWSPGIDHQMEPSWDWGERVWKVYYRIYDDIWWHMYVHIVYPLLSIYIYIYIHELSYISLDCVFHGGYILYLHIYIYTHNFCRYGSKYLLVSMWVRLGNEVPFQEVFGSMIDAHVPGVKIDAQLFRHWATSELLKLLSWIRCITPLCTEARVDSKDPATECAGCGVK